MSIDATDPAALLQRAADLALESVRNGSRPFGALVARDGAILGEGTNRVPQTADPTAHAEIDAMRAATSALGTDRLTGSVIYSSAEPCPMCMAASYWADIAAVVYGATRAEAADAGFNTDAIYRELALPPSERRITGRHVPNEGARQALRAWADRPSG